MTVWTHTQGVYPDRAGALRRCCGVPPTSVRCIHVEGSGCYGHNGADDAAADAALIARAVARASGSRAMDARAGACLGAVRPGDGDQGAARTLDGKRQRSPTGITRSGATPIRCGRAAPGRCWRPQHMAQAVRAAGAAGRMPLPEGGGDRNAMPLYTFPNASVVYHFMPEDAAARFGAARARRLQNVFSIESFMDELARRGRRRSGRVPAAASRGPPRARGDREAAAERFGWKARAESAARPRLRFRLRALQEPRRLLRRRDGGRGRTARPGASRLVRGSRRRGQRPGRQSGRHPQPDRRRRSCSRRAGRCTKASPSTAPASPASTGQTYPILRFDAVPESSTSTSSIGPASLSSAAANAARARQRRVANAIANAIGQRLHDLPLTRERIKNTIGA